MTRNCERYEADRLRTMCGGCIRLCPKHSPIVGASFNLRQSRFRNIAIFSGILASPGPAAASQPCPLLYGAVRKTPSSRRRSTHETLVARKSRRTGLTTTLFWRAHLVVERADVVLALWRVAHDQLERPTNDRTIRTSRFPSYWRIGNCDTASPSKDQRGRVLNLQSLSLISL
jgi:hypothetical protein